MYLNRAEAYLNKGQISEAISDLKKIISRATGKAISEISITEDVESLREEINHERAKELAFEGHRLYDITRRKNDLVREFSTNSIVQEISYPSDLFVLPIPQKELDANTNIAPNPTVNE
jgi:hypothetical protein